MLRDWAPLSVVGRSLEGGPAVPPGAAAQALPHRSESSYFLILVLVWSLLFFGRYGEAQLEMDPMAYCALAKHMVASGDWLVPHYTRSAYDSFYQHPPLFLWLEAAAFRLFGPSAKVARLLPAIFALGTLGVLFLWAGPWRGFVAGIVLLSSRSFVRFGSDAFLDGPLAFWLVLGSFCFLRLEAERLSRPALLCLAAAAAAAFLTKGLVGFSLPAACAIYLLFASRRTPLLAHATLAFGLATVPVVLWIWFGGGGEYLRKYWTYSVSGRITASNTKDYLLPLIVLVRSHWPWLPIYVFGMVRAWRGPARLALIQSLVILAGFSATGHIYEYYLVAFLPFAALVTASALPVPAAGTRRMLARALGVLVIGAAALSLWVPFRIRPQWNDPIRVAAPDALQRCDAERVREVLISDRLAEKWLGLATVLWETPWEATSVQLPLPPASDTQILLAAPQEAPGAEWRAVPVESEAPFRLFSPVAASTCRAQHARAR